VHLAITTFTIQATNLFFFKTHIDTCSINELIEKEGNRYKFTTRNQQKNNKIPECMVAKTPKKTKCVNTYMVKFLPLCRCLHDYLDIYTQIWTRNESLLLSPLHGRYCGKDISNLPSLIRSMGNILVVGFYTNAEISGDGFKLNYTFVSDGNIIITQLTCVFFYAHSVYVIIITQYIPIITQIMSCSSPSVGLCLKYHWIYVLIVTQYMSKLSPHVS